jgi:hypothetical protein
MARDESEREDLLREATALVERIELAPAGDGDDAGERAVAGFRAGGAMSIYFDSEPAYHFNSDGELRRAYCDGLLVKAEAGRLVAMERRRQANEVQLVRHEMTDAEQAEFMSSMSNRLHDFAQKCSGDSFVTVGQVPAEADVLRRVLAFLTEHHEVAVAKSPHAR